MIFDHDSYQEMRKSALIYIPIYDNSLSKINMISRAWLIKCVATLIKCWKCDSQNWKSKSDFRVKNVVDNRIVVNVNFASYTAISAQILTLSIFLSHHIRNIIWKHFVASNTQVGPPFWHTSNFKLHPYKYHGGCISWVSFFHHLAGHLGIVLSCKQLLCLLGSPDYDLFSVSCWEVKSH